MQLQPVTHAAGAQGSLSLAQQPDSSAKIRKGATDFEALLLSRMLRSARESVGSGLTGDESDDSETNSSLVELGEQQFAQALAANGGLGIAKMVVTGLNHAD